MNTTPKKVITIHLQGRIRTALMHTAHIHLLLPLHPCIFINPSPSAICALYIYLYFLHSLLYFLSFFSFSSSFSPRKSFLAQSFLFSSHSIIYTVRPIQNSPPLQFLTIYFNFESVNRSKLMASVFATRVY